MANGQGTFYLQDATVKVSDALVDVGNFQIKLCFNLLIVFCFFLLFVLMISAILNLQKIARSAYI